MVRSHFPQQGRTHNRSRRATQACDHVRRERFLQHSREPEGQAVQSHSRYRSPSLLFFVCPNLRIRVVVVVVNSFTPCKQVRHFRVLSRTAHESLPSRLLTTHPSHAGKYSARMIVITSVAMANGPPRSGATLSKGRNTSSLCSCVLIFCSLDKLSFFVQSIRHQAGPNIINFADGGRITYSLPEAHVGGILFGERIIEYLGTIDFRDEQNGLAYAIPPACGHFSTCSLFLSSSSCDLVINPNEQKLFSSFFSSKKRVLFQLFSVDG